MPLILKVISGAQTGVDQAALRAAKSLQIPTGGMLPRGFLTEDGPRPDLAELYGLDECQEAGYPPRTKANARAGHITIWLGPTGSPGWKATESACKQFGKPFVEILDLDPDTASTAASDVALRVMFAHDSLILNVAGSRESKAPGIGAKAEVFLMEFLQSLASSRFLG